MRLILLFFICFGSVYGYTYNNVIKDYEAGNFEKVCSQGSVFYFGNDKNEHVLTLIGDACGKIDAINPLGYIVKNLVTTAQHRESGSYFATLLLQKKLIYQFMNDDINLKELRLPRTNHILSVVFENLAQGNYERVEKKVKITTSEMDYTLWLSDDNPKKVYIDEYKHGKLIKSHWYL